ncbi:MerR family transcriptional regulator [Curtobacterium sp. 22159]|uniref:MerR family transcriptional regulator n=1 Tax=Curtobacterium sp. 22159 TaxID=3453882 RepID=UPI003F872F9E
MVRVPDASDAVDLTVGQAAARVGVTVRTLHHWDEIALARPSARSAAGYRLYAEDDLERLRRIVVYRELGLDLGSIRSVLDDPSVAVVAALRAQQDQLAARIKRLSALGDDLARMVDAHEHGLLMSAEEQTAMFGSGWNPQWPAEARQLYGDSPQWRQYAERSASRTADDWQTIADTAAALDRALAGAMGAGVEPGTPASDALVEQHREVFSAYFPITRAMQVILGRMYEANAAYAAHYDGVRIGLASWLRRSIDASARAHGIDPDTAAWE